jgi:hypothetical protein
MGKATPGGQEQATATMAGVFTATGAGSALLAPNTGGQRLNVSVWGTFSATAQIERSFDGGTTWLPVSRDVVGTVAVFTASFTTQVVETESGVLYRLNCTAYTSGTANYRLSY